MGSEVMDAQTRRELDQLWQAINKANDRLEARQTGQERDWSGWVAAVVIAVGSLLFQVLINRK